MRKKAVIWTVVIVVIIAAAWYGYKNGWFSSMALAPSATPAATK